MTFKLSSDQRIKLQELLSIEDILLDILESYFSEHYLPTTHDGKINITDSHRDPITYQTKRLKNIAEQQIPKLKKQIGYLSPEMNARLNERFAIELGLDRNKGSSIFETLDLLSDISLNISEDFGKAYSSKWTEPLNLLINFWTMTLNRPSPQPSSGQISRETDFNQFIAIVVGYPEDTDKSMETINKALSRHMTDVK